mgnify:CR=1
MGLPKRKMFFIFDRMEFTLPEVGDLLALGFQYKDKDKEGIKKSLSI